MGQREVIGGAGKGGGEGERGVREAGGGGKAYLTSDILATF